MEHALTLGLGFRVYRGCKYHVGGHRGCIGVSREFWGNTRVIRGGIRMYNPNNGKSDEQMAWKLDCMML